MIRIKNPNSSKLPNEYQEVEYIQSTGTQYINTGVINSSTIYVEHIASFENIHKSVMSGVEYNTSNRFKWGINGVDNLYIGYAGNNRNDNGANASGFGIDDYFTFKIGVGIQEIVGVFSYANTTKLVYSSSPIYLMARNGNGTQIDCTGNQRTKSCKIYDNNVLIRDFVPCYRLSDNVAGLYDLANNVFYTNAGTGTFLMGTEVGRRDMNIKPTIGDGKTLLERYIGNMLVYKRGPSYIYTEFSSCPFPTDWDSIEGSNNNWGKTNNWGYWSIHSSSYSTSSPTYRVTCAFDNSYSTSTYWMPAKLTSATETATVEIDCPIPIKPNSISIMYRYAGGNSVIQGYNDDTGSWEDLSQLTSSTSRRTDTFSIAAENFYSKFRIVFYRYSSTYGNPMLHEFQIKSGTIRQEG